MKDSFAKYVVEEIVDSATDEQLATIVPLLKGRMIAIATDENWNTVIQKMIQMICKLVGNTYQLDIKGRLLTFMNDTDYAFSQSIIELCCHPSAVSIVQSVLKEFPPSQNNLLMGSLSLKYEQLAEYQDVSINRMLHGFKFSVEKEFLLYVWMKLCRDSFPIILRFLIYEMVLLILLPGMIHF
jgi:hypothetical protein